MSCTNPLRAFDTGYLTEKGKPLYYITSRKINMIHKPLNEWCAKSQRPNHVYADVYIKEFIEIPCMKCQSCRLDYSKEWMQRCMLEQKMWAHNEMLTLTYDEEHVPKSEMTCYKVVNETDEVHESKVYNTLRKKDVEKFLKDLRRYWKHHYNEDNIRFYMCGEYGELKGRPHYHLLMFNFNVRDKEYYKKSQSGFDMYHSKIIEKIWGRGHIELNEINADTCAYVARYVLKKQKGTGAKDYYEFRGIVPEYTNGSRRPGIGETYFRENKDKIYEYDKILLASKGGVQEAKPCKYYDRLFDAEEHDMLEEIKARRKELAERRQATLNAISGLSIEKQREYKANALKDRIKKLNRGYENSGF